MTKPLEVIKYWIEACQHPRRPLTPWEEDFLEHVSDTLDNSGGISDRQEEILEQIYAEKTI